MIFALVGNQNSGKTTLFNQLTGANQHVGNFPGVTVDQKVGEVKAQDFTASKKVAEVVHDGKTVDKFSIVDLPGIYSLSPYSKEELITRDFVLTEKPSGIINIVDINNIERNLYLTLQLIELEVPMVLALNMMDEFNGNGGSINIEEFSKELGIPVVPISAMHN
ncbi:MAG: FeoB small GTPase domain-containing protein, partial [Anaerovoracaceae bacterium]